jgi:hypothetical protein
VHIILDVFCNCIEFNKLRIRSWKQLNGLKKGRIKEKDRYNGDLEKAFLDAYFKL